MGASQSSPAPFLPEPYIDSAISSSNIVVSPVLPPPSPLPPQPPLTLPQVFSRTTCSFCDAAKRVLREATVHARVTGCAAAAPPHVLDLDVVLSPAQARSVMAALARRTGAATVPRVFVGGDFVGGAVETERYARSGALGLAVWRGAGCRIED